MFNFSYNKDGGVAMEVGSKSSIGSPFKVRIVLPDKGCMKYSERLANSGKPICKADMQHCIYEAIRKLLKTRKNPEGADQWLLAYPECAAEC